jgi:hypothetical protein
MRKILFLVLVSIGLFAESQNANPYGQLNQYTVKRQVKKPVTRTKSQVRYPVQKPSIKNIVYQYVDTLHTDAENVFPYKGNIGIGTTSPQNALELKRSGGDGRYKNYLLQLSNIWTPNGLNEPSIMFSNGDNSPSNISYWTLGARVSGNEVDKDPVAFKIGFKAPNEVDEHEFFSIDSYGGRVKIGNVNSNVDGYKLYVEEGILTEKVKVAVKNSEDWFDHVLNQDYPLMPISDLEKYIKANNHLPDVPTTKEVMQNGIDLGKMNGILLKKVEELTLYLIEMKKDLEQTKKDLEATKNRIKN